MDRRALIAIILSGIFLFAYPYILKKLYPTPSGPVQREVARKAAPATEKTAAPAPAEKPIAAKEATEEVAVEEKLLTIETPLYRAVVSNIGGGIKSWQLKRYRTSAEENAPGIDLVRGAGLSFITRITKGSATRTVVFDLPAENIVLTDAKTRELVLEGRTPEGLVVEKRLLFDARHYTVGTEVRIRNTNEKTFDGLVATTVTAGFKLPEKKRYFHTGPIVKSDLSLLRVKKKTEKKAGTGKILWLGVENKYFLTVLMPRTEIPIRWEAEIGETGRSKIRGLFAVKLAPGQTAAYAYKSFSGPKKYDLLVKEGHDLQQAIEFGTFAFMAKPLLKVLLFFQRYLGNYGLAIVLLTLVIKVIFYPLTQHSLKSMAGMKKIQPQLVAIKEKYKDDKEKLNREIMALYKKYKVNPLSGCLPMILQIPVFIALYEVLYVSIELRHAPFILWITDLSAKDPYYITPVLMGASMFFQQRLSPSSPDPTQAKMMMFMPVIFTVMFLNFPSGLVIYWLVNNILSIIQQVFINKGLKASAA